ncbi:LINE-1 reverse transcriptase-like [Vitis vinifera]|uniref:LINE-1 reverse transcriptase-like n=1 Tax=Vitis vinifera TaxID=29760 RepID=A0A438K298_VITVI|nr:LINE-1 reverse transcriptase-like [Vitis vinifera]
MQVFLENPSVIINEEASSLVPISCFLQEKTGEEIHSYVYTKCVYRSFTDSWNVPVMTGICGMQQYTLWHYPEPLMLLEEPPIPMTHREMLRKNSHLLARVVIPDPACGGLSSNPFKYGLKKVIGKLVSPAQNAFVMGRQILDASLIANEFLMKVLQKMGFGQKWLGWMWSCISTARFSVLVNGVPAGFFPSTKGLRQGDPLSPYLFVMGMEVLGILLRRAVEGGFLSGCSIREGGESALNISHLFFADDTIIFCEANKEHLSHLSWVLFWFEAASGLKINLSKSEIIPVGEVDDIEELAAEVGCRVGSLPSQYLGLPLGAPNRASSMWDGVEERVRRRLALWKRQYISKGGRITLIKSTMASIPIYQMGKYGEESTLGEMGDSVWGQREGWAGLRRLGLMNKALLGKWIWRYACERENLWKQVIWAKYGQEEYGWRSKKPNGAFGVGVWKEIMKENEWCWDSLELRVGKGNKIRFWTDVWCAGTALSQSFPHLFALAVDRNATVEEMWDQNSDQGGWNLRFLRNFNDWEVGMVGDLLLKLRGLRPALEEDSISWKEEKAVDIKSRWRTVV